VLGSSMGRAEVRLFGPWEFRCGPKAPVSGEEISFRGRGHCRTGKASLSQPRPSYRQRAHFFAARSPVSLARPRFRSRDHCFADKTTFSRREPLFGWQSHLRSRTAIPPARLLCVAGASVPGTKPPLHRGPCLAATRRCSRGPESLFASGRLRFSRWGMLPAKALPSSPRLFPAGDALAVLTAAVARSGLFAAATALPDSDTP
jgi:hypothetical protein